VRLATQQPEVSSPAAWQREDAKADGLAYLFKLCSFQVVLHTKISLGNMSKFSVLKRFSNFNFRIQ
jgi:hypothetical protein